VTNIPAISALLRKCTANVGSVTFLFATIKKMNAHRLATLVTLHTVLHVGLKVKSFSVLIVDTLSIVRIAVRMSALDVALLHICPQLDVPKRTLFF
jgi:hypothetical protein